MTLTTGKAPHEPWSFRAVAPAGHAPSADSDVAGLGAWGFMCLATSAARPTASEQSMESSVRWTTTGGSEGTAVDGVLHMAPPRVTAQPDAEFAGFKIVRALNEGGRGVVYEAIQLSTTAPRNGTFAAGMVLFPDGRQPGLNSQRGGFLSERIA